MLATQVTAECCSRVVGGGEVCVSQVRVHECLAVAGDDAHAVLLSVFVVSTDKRLSVAIADVCCDATQSSVI